MIDLQIAIDSKIYSVDEEKILAMTQKLLKLLKLDNHELSLLITDDKKIHELNLNYRDKDKATDVLSFPQRLWDEPLTLENCVESSSSFFPGELLGDIVISLDHANSSAQSLGHSLSREVCFLIIHGLLHLCGHDHEEPEEEKVMIDQQKKLLQFLEKDSEHLDNPLWEDCTLIKKDSQ